jgi:hypothetical protein
MHGKMKTRKVSLLRQQGHGSWIDATLFSVITVLVFAPWKCFFHVLNN